MAYQSKGESARKWFETAYAAGKGVAEGIRASDKRAAGAEVTASQKAAIPTREDAAMNYDGAKGMDPAQWEAGTAPEINLQYGGDLQGHYKRKRAALDAYAEHSTPAEMVGLEEAYNTQNRKRYQEGLQHAANLMDQKAAPETIAKALTNAYALNPSAVSGVATPAPDGTVAMSFFDEVTGKVYATASMTDANAIRKMAAGVDDPKFQLQFAVTEAELEDQQARTTAIQDTLNHTIKKDKAGAASKLLELDNKAQQAVSTSIAAMNKKLVDRGDKAAQRVLTAMKERPMPEEYNGDYAQYLANATGFMVENPNMSPGESLRITEMLNEQQTAIAQQIMDQDRSIQWDPNTQRVPPEVMARAYQQMAGPGGPIKKQTDTDTGRVSHVWMDGKNPILLPAVVTGEGRPTTRVGLMSQAYTAQAMTGAKMLSDAERKSLKEVVFGFAGAKVDATGGTSGTSTTTTGGAVSGAADETKKTDAKEMKPADEQNILALADKIIARGDAGSANMAKLMMNVQETFGQAAVASIANMVEQRMIEAEKAGLLPPTPAAPAPQQAIPAGVDAAAAYAPAGTQPATQSPGAAIQSAYQRANPQVTPQAVGIPRNR